MPPSQPRRNNRRVPLLRCGAHARPARVGAARPPRPSAERQRLDRESAYGPGGWVSDRVPKRRAEVRRPRSDRNEIAPRSRRDCAARSCGVSPRSCRGRRLDSGGRPSHVLMPALRASLTLLVRDLMVISARSRADLGASRRVTSAHYRDVNHRDGVSPGVPRGCHAPISYRRDRRAVLGPRLSGAETPSIDFGQRRKCRRRR